MRKGPAAVAEHLITSLPITQRPIELRLVIRDVVLQFGWERHPNFALERAEAWEERTREYLRRDLNKLREMGRPARVDFNSSSAQLVQGACFVEPSDSDELKTQKERRSRLDSYLTVIQQLDPEEFEKLCGELVRLLGVENPTVTRRAGDEGIDFYGRLKGESVFFPTDWQPTIQRQLSVWLVGQAKQYLKTQAGTAEIRELVGAVVLGKGDAYSSDHAGYADMRIRVSDPVFSMLVTGGTFSGRAWYLLERAGVVGIDGELLAAFLSDRDAGPGEEPDLHEYRRWLRGLP